MKLFVGIPTIRHYQPFWDSVSSFLPAIRLEGIGVQECIVRGQDIATARNMIAKAFLESDCDYLLFLDDDHSGHTLEMLDAILDPMLENNAYVCAVKCYKKGFPYDTNLLVFSGINQKALGLKEGVGEFRAIDAPNGYMYMDVVGFGMTIIRKKAFLLAGEPYFVSEDNSHEDNYFCKRLHQFGIQPVGCFQYALEHDGISIAKIPELRQEGWDKIKEAYPNMVGVVN